MTPQQINDYLESLATAYVPISHSGSSMRFTAQDMLVSTTPGTKLKLDMGPCLLALDFRYNGKGDNRDNNVVGMSMGFAVIQHYETKMTPSEVVVRDNALFADAMKIIGKIKLDQETGGFGLDGLKPHQFRISKAPSYFDNAKGWEVQIPLDFDASVLMAFNASEWDI